MAEVTPQQQVTPQELAELKTLVARFRRAPMYARPLATVLEQGSYSLRQEPDGTEVLSTPDLEIRVPPGNVCFVKPRPEPGLGPLSPTEEARMHALHQALCDEFNNT